MLPTFKRFRPLPLGILVILIVALTGCLPEACLPENLPVTKKRKQPQDAVEFFQYAFRNGCWKVAYDSLAPIDHEYLDEVDLPIIRWFGPKVKGIPLSEVIDNSTIKWVFPDPPVMMVKLEYSKLEELISLAVLKMPDGSWRVSLVESQEMGYLEILKEKKK